MTSRTTRTLLPRFAKLGFCLFLAGLVAVATFTVPTSGQQSTETINGVPIPAGISRAQAEQMILTAQRQAKTIANVREILTKSGVPFDASILFTRNWRQKVADYSGQLPQLQEVRTLPNKLAGAQLANTFSVPKNVSLTEDTVIIANRLTFSEPETVIKGPHSIYVFLLSDDPGTNDTGTDATSSGKKTVTIDVSGQGRKEWLASVANRTVSPNSTIIDESGQRGRDGQHGNPVYPGPDGANAGPDGPNGTCPQVDGIDGDHGENGFPGRQAEDGEDGVDGGNGREITYIIPIGSTESYTFLSNGGDGGNGGNGGPGGQGGNGKPGGKGGDGSYCGCSTVGRGGRGGKGGDGGPGSTGGKGGKGAKGGNGGPIVVHFPTSFNTSLIFTQAQAGTGGRKGTGGLQGLGGNPGASGEGGKGGRPSTQPCNLVGQDGQVGANGSLGEMSPGRGEDGTNGENGAGGSITMTPINGGGNLVLEPGGIGNDGRTCLDWVLYECVDIDPIEGPIVNATWLCRERLRWRSNICF